MLALYLRDARGPSKSRRVFVRHLAPRVGLSQPSTVAKLAREALQHADLLPVGRVVGPHLSGASSASAWQAPVIAFASRQDARVRWFELVPDEADT